jgi:hypothetical protein
VVRYTRTPGWRDFLGFFAQSGAGVAGGAMKVQVEVPGLSGPAMRPGRCYFLWTGGAE